jgi:hypothetical protein
MWNNTLVLFISFEMPEAKTRVPRLKVPSLRSSKLKGVPGLRSSRFIGAG